jgi:dolichyl-phosphate beta-glucosyltransferase
MTMSTSTWIVIPCYNEAPRWSRDYWKRCAERNDVQFLFVDDGSSDGTHECLTVTAADIDAKVLRLEKNSGKSEAVRAGMLHAIRDGKCGIAGFMDADGAFVPEELGRLLELFAARDAAGSPCDTVWGSRVALSGRDIVRKSSRHYLGRIFATLIFRGLHGVPYDSQCGLKLFRVSGTLESVLGEPFVSRWMFEIEMMARWVAQTGNRPVIWEEPVSSWCDVAGSKVTGKEVFRVAAEALRVRPLIRRAYGGG